MGFPSCHKNAITQLRQLVNYIYIYINGRQVVVPDKNSAQCLKAELYINKSGVKDDTWIFL